MNPLLKRIGIYVIAGVIGGLIGNEVAKRIVPEDPMNRWDYEEGDDIWKEEEEDGDGLEKPWTSEDEQSTEDTSVDMKELKAAKEKPAKSKKVDYTKASKSNKPSLQDLTSKYRGEESSNLHIISLDEYVAGSGFDKESLTYYEEDDILTNEENEIIKDPDKLLGEDALVKFGQGSLDIDIVYIRVEDKKTDYEIIRVHKSYSEDVLGEPPKNEKPSRVRRKSQKVEKPDDDETDDE